MSLSTVRSTIKTALEGISNLNSGTVFAEVPNALGKLPAAILDQVDGVYEQTMGDVVVWNFRLLILTGTRDSNPAHTILDTFLSPSSANGIRNAVESAGDIGDVAKVPRVDNIGFLEYRGKTYLGAEFLIQVVES